MVFPIKGKKWCFSRSVDPFAAQSPSGVTPTTLRGLWKKLSSESKPINANAELLVDFISDKVKLHSNLFTLYIKLTIQYPCVHVACSEIYWVYKISTNEQTLVLFLIKGF